LLPLKPMAITVIHAISIVLFTSYAVLLLYYTYCWCTIPTFNFTQTKNTTTITIIIPARNEAANIITCLNSICANNYPTACYQIIVIDDYSTDATAALVKNYTAKNLLLLQLQNFTHNNIIAYKKKAIEIGIEHATGELIITTDADCIVPNNWLQCIDGFYKKTNAALIVMPVQFLQAPTMLSIFQSLDFITLQGITGASVFKNMHSMCNGANLAYTKKVFNQVQGFKGIDTIASGDDMLLMHKIFALYPHKIKYLKTPEVIVKTPPAATITDFFNQRIRWASKADNYDDKRIFAVLILVYALNVWLVLLGFASFFNVEVLQLFGVILLLKTIVELIFLVPVAHFFSSKKLLWYFPLAQPFHIVYTVIAGWLGKFGSYSWKGRVVK
jgi:glycosyltransferase involved in cell wall biosynthesis